MSYNKNRHDFGILRQDGSTQVGLTLLRDKYGRPAWREFDKRILAEQFFDGRPDFSYVDPQEEIPLRGDTHIAGFGLKYFDDADPKRYWYTTNADARFNNKVIAGPLATTVTKPSNPAAPAITDGNLELWDDASILTNWTFTQDTGTCIQVRDGANQEQGTYCAAIGHPSITGTGHTAQTIDSTNDYAGMECTFTARCNPGANSMFRIAIHDGVTTTYSSYATVGAYQTLSVTKTLSVACTSITVYYYKTLNTAALGYFDGPMTFTVTAPTVGASAASADFNDLHYKSFGTVLAKQNAGGTAYTYVANMPASITDMCVYQSGGTDYLWIAQGDSDNIIYMTAAEAFTETSDGSAKFYYLTPHPAYLYGKKKSTGQLARDATPTTGAFSDVTLVGNGYDDVTDLLTSEDHTIIICKENMPYYLDSSDDDQPLIPQAEKDRSSTSGKNSYAMNNKLYFQVGNQTLYEYDGTPGSVTSVITNISPAEQMEDISAFSGKIQAITGDGNYLYIIMDNSTKVEMLAGRWETVDGSTSWRWHPLAELTLTGCETAMISNHVKKRLWVTSTNASNDIYYYPVTDKYGDIVNDSSYTFSTGGAFYTPWLHGQMKGDDKAFIKITLTLGHTYDADIYFEAHYKKWEDSGWTDIGDFKGTATDRTHTIYLPVDGSSNNPVSKYIMFKFVAKTDDSTKTPILVSYDCRAIWRPTKRWFIACSVLCEDTSQLQSGQKDKITAAEITEVLEEAAAATWPVTLYDIRASTVYVNFLPPMEFETTEIGQLSSSGVKQVKGIYNLILQKVQLS